MNYKNYYCHILFIEESIAGIRSRNSANVDKTIGFHVAEHNTEHIIRTVH